MNPHRSEDGRFTRNPLILSKLAELVVHNAIEPPQRVSEQPDTLAALRNGKPPMTPFQRRQMVREGLGR